ncbi:MAG: InlB B-repeat-containing protein, partial [Enterococcus sp.]|nr:InlB B-repeat-containing protein [Enterococcus sp.]
MKDQYDKTISMKTENGNDGLFLIQADTDDTTSNFSDLKDSYTITEAVDSNTTEKQAYFRDFEKTMLSNEYNGSKLQQVAEDFFSSLSTKEKDIVMSTNLPDEHTVIDSDDTWETDNRLNKGEVDINKSGESVTSTYEYPAQNTYGNTGIQSQRFFSLSVGEIKKLQSGNDVQKKIVIPRNAGSATNEDGDCYWLRSAHTLSNVVGNNVAYVEDQGSITTGGTSDNEFASRLAVNLNCDVISFKKIEQSNDYTDGLVYEIEYNGYKVSFINDGTEISTLTDIPYNSTIADKKPNDPVKDGFTFIGWYREGEQYAFDFEHDRITADTVLTAKYEINNQPSDVSVTENNGRAYISWNGYAKQGMSYDIYRAVVKDFFTKTDDYDFTKIANISFTTNNNGSLQEYIYKDDISGLNKKAVALYYIQANYGGVLSPKSSTVYLCKGCKTIICKDDCGNPVDVLPIETGKSIKETGTVLPDVSRDGYTYTWITDENQRLDEEASINEDITINAKYDLVPITNLRLHNIKPEWVIIKWSKSQSKTASYEIYRDDVKIATIDDQSVWYYKDKSPVQGAVNKYKIVVVDGEHRSSDSNLLSVNVCEKTPKLIRLSTAKKRVKLTFYASKLAKVEIYQSSKKMSGFKKVATTSAKARTYTLSKLTANKTYYFKIRYIAKNKGNNDDSIDCVSSYSLVKSIKIRSGDEPCLFFSLKGMAKGKTQAKLSWAKVSGADKYVLLTSKPGSKKSYSTKISKKKTTYTAKKYGKAKLKKNACYTFTLKAYKGKKLLKKSKKIYVITSNYKGKYSNTKSIKVSASDVCFRAGDTKTITSKLTQYNKKKKNKKWGSTTYISSNTAVVKVSSKGKLTAVKKGTAKIYTIAANGVYAISDVDVENKNYTIKFDANAPETEFTGEMANVAMLYNTSKALPENAYERKGYTFIGWSTKSTASCADYINKSSVKNLTNEQNATVTLYAVWAENGQHESYGSNGAYAIQNTIAKQTNYPTGNGAKSIVKNGKKYHRMTNGMITTTLEKQTSTQLNKYVSAATKINDLATKNDIKFCYVQAPYKTETDNDIQGIKTYANYNANYILKKLRANNVDILDFRDVFNDYDVDYRDAFYFTDHHWRVESGLFASEYLMNYFNDN